MISTWRKKPVTVQAVQWTGDNEAELTAFAGDLFHAVDPDDRGDDPDQTAAIMDTLHNTWVRVYTGQWIIKGTKGEFYPITPEVLAETYERVHDPLPPFSGDETTCTKCGSTAAYTFHRTGGELLSVHRGEHLERSCARCGYEWAEAIAETEPGRREGAR